MTSRSKPSHGGMAMPSSDSLSTCPICRVQFEMHPYHKKKGVPVCSPNGYCHGVWDEREEASSLLKTVRRLERARTADGRLELIRELKAEGRARDDLEVDIVCLESEVSAQDAVLDAALQRAEKAERAIKELEEWVSTWPEWEQVAARALLYSSNEDER